MLHFSQSQNSFTPTPNQVSNIIGLPHFSHVGPSRTRCLICRTGLRLSACLSPFSSGQICISLLNSLSLPQSLHTPLLVAPSAGPMTQWWQHFCVADLPEVLLRFCGIVITSACLDETWPLCATQICRSSTYSVQQQGQIRVSPAIAHVTAASQGVSDGFNGRVDRNTATAHSEEDLHCHVRPQERRREEQVPQEPAGRCAAKETRNPPQTREARRQRDQTTLDRQPSESTACQSMRLRQPGLAESQGVGARDQQRNPNAAGSNSTRENRGIAATYPGGSDSRYKRRTLAKQGWQRAVFTTANWNCFVPCRSRDCASWHRGNGKS
jgi:hypothetical protein